MNVTEIVAKQYTDWAYPKPIDDMAAAIAQGMREPDTPSLVLPALWPERRPIENMKVLVAGCGTNQGAYYALMMPRADITGIDLSSTSLAHEKFLVEKHHIRNLTLHRLSLLDVSNLNEDYDFIVCCGVLHHLADPDAGLRALRDVLRPDGMMSIMIYARFLRLGIYMLQEAFKLLEIGQDKEGVELVRKTIERLPPRHWANFYIKNAPDIGYDSGIVDTFLHPQDRAYTVSEALDYGRRNGLDFWGWVEPALYSVEEAFPPEHPLRNKIADLPDKERWQVIELLTQRFGFHQFFLCHPERVSRRISFDQDDWQNFVPVFRPGLKIVEDVGSTENEAIKVKRGRYRFQLKRAGAALLRLTNGERSISEITMVSRERYPQLQIERVRRFFALMHEWGHLMYWRT